MTATRCETQNPSECLADFLHPAFVLNLSCTLEMVVCFSHATNMLGAQLSCLLCPLGGSGGYQDGHKKHRISPWWCQGPYVTVPAALASQELSTSSALRSESFVFTNQHLSDTTHKVRLRSKARKQKHWKRADELQVWTWSSHKKLKSLYSNLLTNKNIILIIYGNTCPAQDYTLQWISIC